MQTFTAEEAEAGWKSMCERLERARMDERKEQLRNEPEPEHNAESFTIRAFGMPEPIRTQWCCEWHAMNSAQPELNTK